MAVKDMLKEIALKTKQKTGNTHLYAHDFMDDGSKIALTIEIDETHVCKDISTVKYKIYVLIF